MLRQVADLPRQLAQAAALAAPARAALAALPGRGRWTELLVCGMGGSAIGADYAAAWAAPHGARVLVHRGYGVPPWAGATALRAASLIFAATWSMGMGAPTAVSV